MINKNSKSSHRNNNEFYPECVMIAIISGFELSIDEINCCQGGCNKNDFHDSIVERDE